MKLTVIIREEAPLIHTGDPCTHRSVSFDLTYEQKALLALLSNTEVISCAFFDPTPRRGEVEG